MVVSGIAKVDTGKQQAQLIQVGAYTTVHSILPIYSSRAVKYSIKAASRLRLCPTNLLSLATPLSSNIILSNQSTPGVKKEQPRTKIALLKKM